MELTEAKSQSPTAEDYQRIYEEERQRSYPAIDAFERHYGYAIDRGWLENVAYFLACPFKKNPPCWQHGRVIYSVLSHYLANSDEEEYTFLDIGTAKGFSAIIMQLCIEQANKSSVIRQASSVVSLDVIDPFERRTRNSVIDAKYGPSTLFEILTPWAFASRIFFIKLPASTWLMANNYRINFAFIDGKHTYEAVSAELRHLSKKQCAGEKIVVDDMQIPGVHKAVEEMKRYYHMLDHIQILENRAYAVLERV